MEKGAAMQRQTPGDINSKGGQTPAVTRIGRCKRERSECLIRKTDREHGFRRVWWRIISTQSCLSSDPTVTSQLYCQIVYEPNVSQETLCLPQHWPSSCSGDQQAAHCLMNIDPTLRTAGLSTDPPHMHPRTQEGQGSPALLLWSIYLKCLLIYWFWIT